MPASKFIHIYIEVLAKAIYIYIYISMKFGLVSMRRICAR